MNKKSILNILLVTSLMSPISAAIANEQASVPVTIETISSRSFEDIIQEVGKINAIDSAALTFSAGEKITAIHFRDGDTVGKGDLIAELDSTKAKADFDKAKSSLGLAKTKLARIQNLLAKQPDALSPQDVDEMREEVNLAKADFSQKKAALGDYQIIAPFNGQLTSFTQSIGSHIAASTTLVSIYNLNPVEVKYAISQNDLGKAAKGQTVTVTVEAFKNTNFKGVVDYVAPAVDVSSGRVEIHARIDNPDNRLAPGMFANVKQLFHKGNSHLVVPQNSVLAQNDKRYVWLYNNSGATKQSVTLGKNTNDGYVIVDAGLKEGDQVITTGQQKLEINTPITVINHKPAVETSEQVSSEASKEKPEPTLESKTEQTSKPALVELPSTSTSTSTSTKSASVTANETPTNEVN
ncbi:efflux RND transporter periplasmic adaptor subunit [Photobacterium profundum]|uniref:efflux RND transporter periplasmic adaptor subunit n=1 Tax=Photobacterium profundum TaxID=74109 RepID=UPI003D0D264D